MNIGLNLSWRFNLDDEVDIWNVETPRSNIGSYENLEFAFFESFQCHFSLILGDISMHDLNFEFDLVTQNELICFDFRTAKNDSLSVISIAKQEVCNSSHFVLERAVNGEMLDILCSLVLE